MAIIFFGTPSFAVPSLEKLLAGGEDIALVVTQPDRIGGRGHGMIPSHVKVRALERDIKIAQPETIRSADFLHSLERLRPEFIAVVAFGKIIPKDILDIPEKGCINVHASLLPKYRGAAPVQWAIINGEATTGITTILMDEGLDTGDILIQREVTIEHNDTGESLFKRLSPVGANVLWETIQGLRDGSVSPSPQEGEPTYAPLLKKEDGLIDWTTPAEVIVNRVRGLYPWPCAYSYLRGKLIKFIEAEARKGDGSPGEAVWCSQKGICIGTSKGSLCPRKVQVEGKRPLSIQAFLRGSHIKAGERFG